MLYRQAMSYLKNGLHEFALLKLQHIIEVYPDSKYADEARFKMGEIYFKQGVFWNAEEEFNKHAKLYPSSKFKNKRTDYLKELNGMNLADEGNDLYKDKKWVQALDAYMKALKLNPKLSSVKDKITECNEMIKHEESQIAKGLVKYEGEWVTPEEKSKLVFAKKGLVSPEDRRKELKDKDAFSGKTLKDLKPIYYVSSKTTQKDFEEIDKAIVAIKTENGHGSGFLINSDGYAITNYHVVKEVNSITSYLTGGKPIQAEVVRVTPEKDLAIIKLIGKKYDFLELGNKKNVGLGDEVYAAGAPASIGLMNSISKGIVSGIREFEDEGDKITLIQTDASVNPGNSGGPLIDKNGSVIGVVALKLSSYNMEGLSFAISIEDVKKFLNLKEDKTSD